MKVKLISTMLDIEIIATAIKTSSTTYSIQGNAVFNYSAISNILYCDANVYMIDITFGVVRVYTQIMNKSGKWSKAINISNDIKAVIL